MMHRKIWNNQMQRHLCLRQNQRYKENMNYCSLPDDNWRMWYIFGITKIEFDEIKTIVFLPFKKHMFTFNFENINFWPKLKLLLHSPRQSICRIHFHKSDILKNIKVITEEGKSLIFNFPIENAPSLTYKEIFSSTW